MEANMKRKLLGTLLVTLAVQGCATQQGTSALECGGGGAVAALLVCKLAGGNNQTCAAAAAGVGAAGAAICYSYANKIQQHRKELAQRGDSVNARIQYLQSINKDTDDLNRQLAQRLNAVTQSTDQAVEALARGQTTRDQLARERKSLDNEVKSAQAQVDTADQELRSAQDYRAQQFKVQQTSSNAQANELDAQIARLQNLLSQAQRNTTALAEQRQRI
jgi:hypothetical protein